MGKINIGRVVLVALLPGLSQIFWISWWMACGCGRFGTMTWIYFSVLPSQWATGSGSMCWESLAGS